MKKGLLILMCLLAIGCGKKEEDIPQEVYEEPAVPKKVEIVDVNSKTRPFAVVVNNTPVAVKVQEGLQKAYMVYEIPVEGNMTRLLAFYKDIGDLKIGTIRSARHNFLDYVFEQDAIFVHWGWSHYAKDQINSLKVNNLNGLSDSSFWRENPEGLATEHTGYTSIGKSRELAQNKGYSLITDKGLVFEYSTDEIDLSSMENSISATNIVVPSSASLNTSYSYDSEKKIYLRNVNGEKHIDHLTKEQYTVKNIIIEKINTKVASDGKYWDLTTTGTGEGIYITNGYAVPIKWSKQDRYTKTVYSYLDDTPIKLNDGNTFIQLQSNNQNYTIG